jgi:hypothetical protein
MNRSFTAKLSLVFAARRRRGRRERGDCPNVGIRTSAAEGASRRLAPSFRRVDPSQPAGPVGASSIRTGSGQVGRPRFKCHHSVRNSRMTAANVEMLRVKGRSDRIVIRLRATSPNSTPSQMAGRSASVSHTSDGLMRP